MRSVIAEWHASIKHENHSTATATGRLRDKDKKPFIFEGLMTEWGRSGDDALLWRLNVVIAKDAQIFCCAALENVGSVLLVVERRMGMRGFLDPRDGLVRPNPAVLSSIAEKGWSRTHALLKGLIPDRSKRSRDNVPPIAVEDRLRGDPGTGGVNGRWLRSEI